MNYPVCAYRLDPPNTRYVVTLFVVPNEDNYLVDMGFSTKTNDEKREGAKLRHQKMHS